LEDETAKESVGHPPTYAVAKRMKLLALHILAEFINPTSVAYQMINAVAHIRPI